MAAIAPMAEPYRAASPESFIPRGLAPADAVVPEPAFWPRLRRAGLMLAVAVSAHLWLVRAPEPAGPMLPAQPAPMLAGALDEPESAPARGLLLAPASARPARAPDAVTLEVVTVEVPGAPPAPAAPFAVATSGLVVPGSSSSRGAQSPRPRVLPSDLTPRAIAAGIAGFVAPEAAAALRLDPERREPLDAPAPREPEVLSVVASAAAAPVAPLLDRRPAAVPDSLPVRRLAGARLPGAVVTLPVAEPARPDLSIDEGQQEQFVLAVLHEYRRAFERLDVQAAKAVWPSLDDRALRRAFHRLDGQEVRFSDCGVSISGREANARCRGDATYHPKVGSRVLRLTEREWTFNLSRDEGRWRIVNANLQ